MSDPPTWVLHVDLDEFLAAVEIARRPELAGKPVVVGGAGDPTLRAVVATASYEARAYGVRSGMPLRTAARLCPDAVFLPADNPTYEAVSEEVMAVLRTFPVVVEVLGWDEAFLGVQARVPEVVAREVQVKVRDETGLSCAVGIGDTRLRAKVATGFGKPAGIYRLTKDNWVQVMGGRPPDAVWGVGDKTRRKLADMGIHTVLDLARADRDNLAKRFGPTMGPWYRALALGGGDATVTAAPYVPRSRSREVTFQRNVTDPQELERHLVELARRVADDVHEEGRPVARMGVKVRFAPFFTHTRSVTLAAPTRDPAVIGQGARDALARFAGDHPLDRPIRLLGVRAEFVPDAAEGDGN